MPVQTSVQLFTLRNALEADLRGTLREVADRGFSAVEPYDFVGKAPGLATELRDLGLSSPTGHAFLVSSSFVDPDGATTDRDVPELDLVFEAAATLGMGTIVDPYTPAEAWNDADSIKIIADGLNAAAEAASNYGLRVGYHNHAHEVEAQFGGVSGLEFLAELLDPRVVLEVDLYWVARGGRNVPGLVSNLGDRVRALHVKDGTLDPSATGWYPPADQVVAGEGVVPIRQAMQAATALEYAVVEFDHFEGDIYEAIEQSRLFIEGGPS